LGRLLATLATILILLLGAAFALPAFVDWNRYRSGIEKTASALLGQKVSILGDIDIVLLPQPHLRASSVASGIGQADGALLTADAIDVSLSLQGLLGGRLEAGKVKLVRPSLTLDFAKPLQKPNLAAEAGALPFTAEIRSVEIEGGRLSILSRKGGPAEALALNKINGVAAAASPGAYRFNGYFSHNGRTYEAKLSGASAQPRTVRLSGSALDVATRAAFQADGSIGTSQDPSFEGALTLTLPPSPSGLNRIPFDIQLKSAARIGLTDAVLNDLVLTLDPQNRPQVLAGYGAIAFNTKSVDLALQTRSLDADTLLLSSSGAAAAAGAAEPAEWSTLGAAAGHFLWLYPGFAVNLSLEAGLVQLKGEPIEGVKIHGSRTGMAQRWVFDQAAATLPGSTAVTLAGTLSRAGGLPQLVATAAFDGKNAGRLGRWLAPSLLGAKTIAASPFNLKGAITLSDAADAFEGIAGNVDGTSFMASVRFDKAPLRKLQLSFSGDNLDLSAFDSAADSGDPLSPAHLKNAWQMGLEQAASLLGAGPQGFDSADIDISARSIKTGGTEARNVAVHAKFGQDMVAVSKLSAETESGLVLRGEGSLPLRGAGQGRFEGRLEARSPQAIVHAAALLGYGRGAAERSASNMAPAVFSISYNSEAATGMPAAVLRGNLGAARIEGSAQLKGPLQAWKTSQLSAQMRMSEPDGNKLLELLFPNAILTPGASLSPGILVLGLIGNSERLETTANLNTGALQLQLDGTSSADDQAIAFKGKASASSQTPEQFLPAPLLALLGGEPKVNMRVNALISGGPGRIDANEIKAETPRNLVTGHLAADASGPVTRFDADLKADQASLLSLLGYFLAANRPETAALAVPAALGAPAPPPDLWSGRPFALSAFRESAGRISLTAKAMKLSDAIVLSDAQLRASLDKGRLDLESLKGQTLDGRLEASLSLTAKENNVAAEADISLAGADLTAMAAPGIAPIMSGRGSLSLFVSGQGLSPRGLISVLQGRGRIRLSGGVLPKLSPMAVQASADELLGKQLPLTEEAVTKRALEAAQSNDFAFRALKIPVTVTDGVLEIRRASFRGREATVRMEAYVDLNKAQADSTWQLGVSSDRRAKWPPVKVTLSGPVRELGNKPRTLAAEDFARAVLVRKMEGDISRLEGLNSSNKPPVPAPAWTTKQEPAPKKSRKNQRNGDDAPPAVSGTPGQTRPAGAAQAQTFEQRMRDVLDNRTSNPPPR
jgi:uncharacterized protein involved in outer membrane biogenesis